MNLDRNFLNEFDKLIELAGNAAKGSVNADDKREIERLAGVLGLTKSQPKESFGFFSKANSNSGPSFNPSL